MNFEWDSPKAKAFRFVTHEWVLKPPREWPKILDRAISHACLPDHYVALDLIRRFIHETNARCVAEGTIFASLPGARFPETGWDTGHRQGWLSLEQETPAHPEP